MSENYYEQCSQIYYGDIDIEDIEGIEKTEIIDNKYYYDVSIKIEFYNTEYGSDEIIENIKFKVYSFNNLVNFLKKSMIDLSKRTDLFPIFNLVDLYVSKEDKRDAPELGNEFLDILFNPKLLFTILDKEKNIEFYNPVMEYRTCPFYIYITRHDINENIQKYSYYEKALLKYPNVEIKEKEEHDQEFIDEGYLYSLETYKEKNKKGIKNYTIFVNFQNMILKLEKLLKNICKNLDFCPSVHYFSGTHKLDCVPLDKKLISILMDSKLIFEELKVENTLIFYDPHAIDPFYDQPMSIIIKKFKPL